MKGSNMPEEMASDTSVSQESSSDYADNADSHEDSDQGESQDQSIINNDTQQDAEYTEKGTRLDPNPMSRINQELANERRKAKEYEDILNNPKLLKAYVDQFESENKEVAVAKEPEEDLLSIQDVQTTEDLQKFLKQQDSTVKNKLKELDSTISGFKESFRGEAVATKIASEITAVREAYPELDPKNSSYNPELDQVVGELFEDYDLDKKSGQFQGKISLKTVADRVMRASKASKKQGSLEARTNVIDKRSGRAISGGRSASQVDESNMTASQIIAQRAKLARSRG